MSIVVDQPARRVGHRAYEIVCTCGHDMIAPSAEAGALAVANHTAAGHSWRRSLVEAIKAGEL